MFLVFEYAKTTSEICFTLLDSRSRKLCQRAGGQEFQTFKTSYSRATFTFAWKSKFPPSSKHIPMQPMTSRSTQMKRLVLDKLRINDVSIGYSTLKILSLMVFSVSLVLKEAEGYNFELITN